MLAGGLLAQITGDVIGMHDLGPGSIADQAPRPGSCTYCHVPHSGNGNMAPLWNQKLIHRNLFAYTSTTYLTKACRRCRWAATAISA